MSLKNIINKIYTDAAQEEEKINKEMNDELIKISQASDRDTKNIVKGIIRKGEARIVKLNEQSEFKQRMIKKNAVLEAKQGLMDQVFLKAEERLTQLNDKDYIGLMRKLFKEAPRVEQAEVITSKKRQALVAAAMRQEAGDYKISNKYLPDGQEGFIISSATIEVNNTIENLDNSKRGGLEPDVVTILFN